MSAQASPGWLVVIRQWGQPDEHWYAAIPDPRDAEEQVRDAVQATGQVTVQTIRELTQAEIDSLGLQPGKIVHLPNK